MKKESWRRNHGAGIVEEESWRRNHGEGIMEEVTQESPGGAQEAPGGTKEAPGGTQEAPRRQPGGTQVCVYVCSCDNSVTFTMCF